MPGGMPGGVPTPERRAGASERPRPRGLGARAPSGRPGWDGRPRPPGAPDGDGFGFL